MTIWHLLIFLTGYWLGHWVGKSQGLYEAVKLVKKLNADHQEERELK